MCTVTDNIRKIMNHQTKDAITEKVRIENELIKIENDIEAIFSLFTEVGKDSPSAKLINGKLEKLAEKKRKLTNYKTEVILKNEEKNDIEEARVVIEANAVAFKKG